MAKRAAVLVRAAKADTPAVSDKELLRRFAGDGDQPAFAEVAARHGAMVLGVCKRVVHSQADAEDACQAVFLILSKKAGTTRWQSSVANWLYSVARKVARNARVAASRRTRREGAAAVAEAVPPTDTLTGPEVLAALDEELERLPPRYREPLVLCYLEGLTRDEAATRLGVPEATLKSQLERGRKKLADALTARGCALGVALLLTATSSAGASPPRLAESIRAAVNGAPSSAASALAQGVAVNGVLTRMKLAILAAVGLVAVGFGAAAIPLPTQPPKPSAKMEKPKADAPKGEPKKVDATERTISGKVVGPDGKPVAADLTLHWAEGTVQPLGRANADGTFRLTVPLQKKGLGGALVATAAGCGPDFHDHGFDYLPASATPTAELVFKLPKERTIRGRVVTQEGKPAAGATVAAFQVNAHDSDVSLDARLKTWAERADGNPLGSERGMQYPKAGRPPTVVTDTEGRFELGGFGVGQTVQLRIGGDGIAVKGLVCVIRDGFDPAPLIQTAIANAGKRSRFKARWLLCGPDFATVVEPEKLVRGRVTDHDGNPRAGVRVQVTRTTSDDLTDHWYWHEATTNQKGEYVIRGLRKYPAYMVEADGDPKAGQLPSHASATDTVGYEPIRLDVKSERGVVVTGRVTDKATGKPIRASVRAAVLGKNPFARQFPTFLQPGASGDASARTEPEGAFRVVTIPGPVLLIVRGRGDDEFEYKPPVPDPNYPHYFGEAEGSLLFESYRRGRDHLNGCWCKVIDAKPTDAEVTVNVELEPATRTAVKVIDGAGRPVAGAHATGVSHKEYAGPTEATSDTLTVFNLDAKKDRLLAVVHPERKLVGTLTLAAGAKDAVVKLGGGGSATGRAVDADGEPLAGLTVRVEYTRREVAEAVGVLKSATGTTTDANGEFRIDTLFPDQAFRLLFDKGKKRIGPDPAPKYTLEKHGGTLKLGDLKLSPPQSDGE